jgi:hypothetical protein
MRTRVHQYEVMRWLMGLGCTVALVAGMGTAAGAAHSTTHPAPGPVARPTDLPKNCTTAPQLAAVSPTPTFPSGYQILDAVPGALATQYPSVYGGEIAAPATPGESAVEINSHFVVLERVHDPALEAEARAAYPAPLTVAFQLTPRPAACLRAIASQVMAAWPELKKLGLLVSGSGDGPTTVNVSVTTCSARGKRLARNWFATRWGSAVVVSVCQKFPTAEPGPAGT